MNEIFYLKKKNFCVFHESTNFNIYDVTTDIAAY